MTALTAPPADTRARLHQLIDQITDEAVLQAALLLLAPQAALPETEEIEPELSQAARAALDEGIRQLDAGQGQPWREVMSRLMNQPVA